MYSSYLADGRDILPGPAWSARRESVIRVRAMSMSRKAAQVAERMQEYFCGPPCRRGVLRREMHWAVDLRPGIFYFNSGSTGRSSNRPHAHTQITIGPDHLDLACIDV